MSVVVWHELECGGYQADLPLWRELADAAGSSAQVLDVGAGSGRVTLELARAGHRLTALDHDEQLLAALREHAHETAPAGAVSTVCADARHFQLEHHHFDLCIVPMQTLQLLDGEHGRSGLLRSAHAHLAPGALLACAIVTHVDPFDCSEGDEGPEPEVAHVGQASYVSRPTRVLVEEHVLRIERERTILPDGPAGETEVEHDVVELDLVSPAQLRAEARAAGFAPAGTRAVAETSEYAPSTVVLFRA